jgi:hypothetical protein
MEVEHGRGHPFPDTVGSGINACAAIAATAMAHQASGIENPDVGDLLDRVDGLGDGRGIIFVYPDAVANELQ